MAKKKEIEAAAADTTKIEDAAAIADTAISGEPISPNPQDEPAPDHPFPAFPDGAEFMVPVASIGDVRFFDKDGSIWYMDEQRKGLFILRRISG